MGLAMTVDTMLSGVTLTIGARSAVYRRPQPMSRCVLLLAKPTSSTGATKSSCSVA